MSGKGNLYQITRVKGYFLYLTPPPWKNPEYAPNCIHAFILFGRRPMAVSEKNIDMYNISELAGLVSTAIEEINNTGAVVPT